MAKETPVRVRRDDENLYHMVEVLDVLRLGISTWKGGRKSAWLIISAFLHQLLTDRSKGNDPLAERVLSGLKLHPMRDDISKATSLWHVPVEIKGSELKVFDWSKPKIPLASWLNQTAYIQPSSDKGIHITIQDVIREPRHQAGGVHFDEEVGEKMALIEGILSFVQIGEDRMSYRDYIAAIGEYVFAALNSQLIGALGNGYISQGNNQKAKGFFDTALSLCHDLGDQQGLAEELANIGRLHYRLGEYAESVKCYTDALEICRSIEDADAEPTLARSLMIALLGLGNRLFQDSRAADTIEVYKQALSLSRQIGDTAHQIILLSNLGIAYKETGDTKKAMGAWLAAHFLNFDIETIDSTDAGPIRPVIAKILHNLATLRRAEPDFDTLVTGLVADQAQAITEITGQHYDYGAEQDPVSLLQDINNLLDEAESTAAHQ